MTDLSITPPPELVEQWRREPEYAYDTQPKTMVTMTTDRLMLLSKKSAQYGADQELEACCAATHTVYGKSLSDWLRNLRRPKRPSLKEQALAELETLSDYAHGLGCSESAIRRALEQLND